MKLPAALRALVDRILLSWPHAAVLFKAMSFAMIGVVNVMVDVVFFTLGYVVIGLPLVLANVFSWCVAVTGSYVMNSMITFARETGRKLTLRAYLTFAGTGILSLAVNTTVLVLVARTMPIWVAKGCAILVSFMINFSISHFFVFRSRVPRSVPIDHDVV